ncbi:hypothetical protein [Sphingobacterium sp.]|uniref:hypothetical protein n=1 Tax=Sphingobacterium sp. TaxID=341027 RepID=UPI00289861C7|nr:hypothetical protein [Sphingobacterium sp.]
MKIKVDMDQGGFLKEAKYSFHFHSIMEDYENSFKGLETLILKVEEDFFNSISLNSAKEWYVFDQKQSELTIIFSEQAFINKKGRELPSAESVFQNLKSKMKNAVVRYNTYTELS